jgi:rhamnosyltransferase
VSSQVLAVVPIFRPNPDDLLNLIIALTSQHIPVVVADDASPCTVDPVLRAAADLGARVVRHGTNDGIARSLNDGLRFADEVGARWLLTVDQDSTLTPDYLESLLAAAESAESILGLGQVGAVAAGGIADASGALTYPVTVVDGVSTTAEVIQTGTIWAVDALLALGGFDESLGIDAVDAAACLALRRAGMRIVLAPGIEITHRVGDGRQVRVLGRDVLASGHSPERHTTIVRNRLRLFPAEFVQSPTHALRTLRRVAVNTALAVTVEDNRWAKAKGSARGLLPRKNG